MFTSRSVLKVEGCVWTVLGVKMLIFDYLDLASVFWLAKAKQWSITCVDEWRADPTLFDGIQPGL